MALYGCERHDHAEICCERHDHAAGIATTVRGCPMWRADSLRRNKRAE